MSTSDKDKIDLVEREKIGWKDILAIAIAQLSILIPIALGGALVMTLLLLFFTKVWMKG